MAEGLLPVAHNATRHGASLESGVFHTIEHRALLLCLRRAADLAERRYHAARREHRPSARLLRKWQLAKARLAAGEVSPQPRDGLTSPSHSLSGLGNFPGASASGAFSKPLSGGVLSCRCTGAGLPKTASAPAAHRPSAAAWKEDTRQKPDSHGLRVSDKEPIRWINQREAEPGLSVRPALDQLAGETRQGGQARETLRHDPATSAQACNSGAPGAGAATSYQRGANSPPGHSSLSGNCDGGRSGGDAPVYT